MVRWVVLLSGIVAVAFAAVVGCGSRAGDVLQGVEAGLTSEASPQPEASAPEATPESSVDGPVAEGGVDAGCDGAYDSDPNNCGACGHGCLGGACVAGQCQPVLLATTPNPGLVAVDDTRFYWSVLLPDAGEIHSAAKDGSHPQTLATGLSNPQSLYVDSTNVFWAEVGVPGDIVASAKDGGAQVVLDRTGYGPVFVLSDATSVYWLDLFTFRGVLEIPRAGLPDGGAPTVLAQGWPYVWAMAQDDTYIYFTSEGSGALGQPGSPTPGKILRVRKDGTGGTTVLVDGLGDPHYVAVDATAVYFTDQAFGTVMRMPNGATTAVQLAQGKQPFGVAVDGTYVYFGTVGTDQFDGTVQRVPKDGSGPAVVLAKNLSWPSQLALDDRAIYWGGNGGTVMKLAK